MRSSRSGLALGVGALCLVAALVPIARSGASATGNENASTLDISLPGPFTGCSYLDPGATVTSDAILDLVRPRPSRPTSTAPSRERMARSPRRS